MSRKSTTTTSKPVVKITETEGKAHDDDVVKNNKKDKKLNKKTAPDGPRWYHFLALLAVLVLAGFAAFKLLNRYDPSIFGAAHTVEVFHGCTATVAGPLEEKDLKFKSYGLHVGDLIGKNGLTKNRDEAYVEIVQFEQDYVIVNRHSDDNDWAERTVNYGSLESVYLNQTVSDCAESLLFTIY